MKLSLFETVIIAGAFFSMVFSFVMWFINANALTAVFRWALGSIDLRVGYVLKAQSW